MGTMSTLLLTLGIKLNQNKKCRCCSKHLSFFKNIKNITRVTLNLLAELKESTVLWNCFDAVMFGDYERSAHGISPLLSETSPEKVTSTLDDADFL